jgi:hypothetical protein
MGQGANHAEFADFSPNGYNRRILHPDKIQASGISAVLELRT